MDGLDPRITDRLRGSTWDDIRETVVDISEQVLSAAPGTRAELTTIYAKFAVSHEVNSAVYAVVWLKTAKNVVIGFSLPDTFADDFLTDAPPGMMYKGLTKYFLVKPGTPVPTTVKHWARVAFNVASGVDHIE